MPMHLEYKEKEYEHCIYMMNMIALQKIVSMYLRNNKKIIMNTQMRFHIMP